MRRVLGLLIVVLAGCGPKAAEPRTESAAPDATRTLTGTLRRNEPPQRKSVEAYLFVEFALESDGTSTALSPSESAPRQALADLAGRAVTLTCVPKEGGAPDPRESHPMGPDGQPMKRPATCRVTSIQAR